MAAGEVLLSGAQIGTTGASGFALSNLVDFNALTYWQTSPTNPSYAGMDAGAACTLTRVRLSPLGGSEDLAVGGIIAGNSSNSFAPPGGSVAFVQGNGTFNGGSGNATIASTFSGAQTAGNANIVCVSGLTGSVSSITDTKGNTYSVIAGPLNNLVIYACSSILSASGGANTVTVHFSPNMDFPTLAIMEYSGLATSNVVDASGSSSGTGTSPTSGNFTTTNANDTIVAFLTGGDNPTITAGSGYTLRVNLSTGWDGATEDKSVSSTGTYSANFSLSSSQNWQVMAVALKAASSGGSATSLYTIPSRPTSGTLLNEYTIPNNSYRYFAYQAPNATFGNVADLDFIARWTPGISAQCCTPTASPAGGLYDLPIVVTLSCITTDAALYYTLDGSTPTTGSTLYGGPFVVGSSATLKILGVSANVSNSRVASYIFTIPSAIVSAQVMRDNRNYPMLSSTEGSIFQDPVSGWWYLSGICVDEIGTLVQGFQGANLYKSADLRNWSYVGNILGPNPGTQINNGTYYAGPNILYNAANNNYVSWQSTGAGLRVCTASNVAGPWTQFATYAALDGQTDSSGDHNMFLDPVSGKYFLIHVGNSNTVVTFSRLNANYTNVDGILNATYNCISTFGFNTEGPAMFYNSSSATYFFMFSNTTNWQPNTNEYATGSTPIGPWTNKGNPFQATSNPDALGLAGVQYGISQGNCHTIAFDSQTSQLLSIPGRGFSPIYFGNRYDNGIPSSGFSSTTLNMQAYCLIRLPITFPTGTTMAINWNSSWTLDSIYPNVSGAPLLPTNLAITSGTARWSNNESAPHVLYLDFATDIAFTHGVIAELIGTAPASSQPVSYIPITPLSPGYYRLRAVNANGTTSSAPLSFSAPTSVGSVFLSQLNTATRFVQLFIGESVTIGSLSYPCTQAENVSADFQFESGGALQWTHGSVIVSKIDLANEPVRGSPVTFRSLLYRVTEVFDLVVNWEIHFIQKSD